MKKAKIVAFTGIDGSGKTSVSLALTRALAEKNYKAKYIHTNAPTILDYVVKRRTLNGSERSSGPGSFYMPYLIAVKDFLVLFLRVTPHLFNNDFVICDRYILDTVVKLRYAWGKIVWLEKFLFVLKPAFLFLLLAPPQVTCERDQEHSFYYHCRKHELYLQVFKEVENARTSLIPSDKGLNEIEGEILSRLSIAGGL